MLPGYIHAGTAQWSLAAVPKRCLRRASSKPGASYHDSGGKGSNLGKQHNNPLVMVGANFTGGTVERVDKIVDGAMSNRLWQNMQILCTYIGLTFYSLKLRLVCWIANLKGTYSSWSVMSNNSQFCQKVIPIKRSMGKTPTLQSWAQELPWSWLGSWGMKSWDFSDIRSRNGLLARLYIYIYPPT